MAQYLFANNAATTLASDISTGATSLVVTTGTGSLFPSPSAGQQFNITLVRLSDSAYEIVTCTSRSTDTFTIVRAQESTTALAFVTGDKVELRVTKAGLDNFTQPEEAISWTAQQTFKELKDTAYNMSTGTSIDPANGTIQYKTLTGNTTFTEALEEGQTVLLAIDDGTAYTATWPTTTWVKSGGTASAPTLATTGYTWILLWKLSTVLYGTLVGSP